MERIGLSYVPVVDRQKTVSEWGIERMKSDWRHGIDPIPLPFEGQEREQFLSWFISGIYAADDKAYLIVASLEERDWAFMDGLIDSYSQGLLAKKWLWEVTDCIQKKTGPHHFGDYFKHQLAVFYQCVSARLDGTFEELEVIQFANKISLENLCGYMSSMEESLQVKIIEYYVKNNSYQLVSWLASLFLFEECCQISEINRIFKLLLKTGLLEKAVAVVFSNSLDCAFQLEIYNMIDSECRSVVLNRYASCQKELREVLKKMLSLWEIDSDRLTSSLRREFNQIIGEFTQRLEAKL